MLPRYDRLKFGSGPREVVEGWGRFATRLENHVLEQMGDAGTKVFAFVDAAGFHPCLGADHRGRGIGVQNGGEAITENMGGSAGSGELHGRNLGAKGNLCKY